jgi:hypothetical protein
MKTINVAVGDEVSVLVQISPIEQFEYEGTVVAINESLLTLSTTDSPHKTYTSEREVDILLSMIHTVDLF